MDEKDIILITISGHRGSGKSSILFFLKGLFKMLGFKTNITYRDTSFEGYEKRMFRKDGRRLIHIFREFMRERKKIIFLKEEDNNNLRIKRKMSKEYRGYESYDIIDIGVNHQRFQSPGIDINERYSHKTFKW